MSKNIDVCSQGHPLIFTFAFSGYENYCLCGRKYDMFGDHREPETPALKLLLKKYTAIFNKLREHMIGGGAHLKDCDKCNSEPHWFHATDKEKELHNKSMAKLEQIAESYD